MISNGFVFRYNYKYKYGYRYKYRYRYRYRYRCRLLLLLLLPLLLLLLLLLLLRLPRLLLLRRFFEMGEGTLRVLVFGARKGTGHHMKQKLKKLTVGTPNH